MTQFFYSKQPAVMNSFTFQQKNVENYKKCFNDFVDKNDEWVSRVFRDTLHKDGKRNC